MTVTLSNDAGVGIISLERPPANAYDAALLNELAGAILQVRDDAAIRVAVIRSALPRFFCAGADITTLRGSDKAAFANFLVIAHEVVDMIGRTPKLFIAAIAGHCIGGGLQVCLGAAISAWPAPGNTAWGWERSGSACRLAWAARNACRASFRRAGRCTSWSAESTLGPEEAVAAGVVDRLFAEDGFWDEVMAMPESSPPGRPWPKDTSSSRSMRVWRRV